MSDLSGDTSVLIPTFRRPDFLKRCLTAVMAADPPPREIIVVHNEDDYEARDVLARYPGVNSAVVHAPGVLAKLEVGRAAARGSLLALLDDDTQIPYDWLRRITVHFKDPSVGGVCGRDIVTHPDTTDMVDDVGRVTRWGKVEGHHHRMRGPVRDVDVLKGAASVYRRDALRFPTDLRGTGAQMHWEVATCSWITEAGLRCVIDPSVEVLHLPGPRFGPDARSRPAFSAAFDTAFNLVVALCTTRRNLLWRRIAFGLGVGDAACPGVARALVAILRRERHVVRLWAPSALGQIYAAGYVSRGAGRRR